jgi:hypothetical protein
MRVVSRTLPARFGSQSTEQYHYVWKTDKAWAGTCLALEVKLIDGSGHLAYYLFKK